MVSSNQLESQLFLNVTQTKEGDTGEHSDGDHEKEAHSITRHSVISYTLLGSEEIRKRNSKARRKNKMSSTYRWSAKRKART